MGRKRVKALSKLLRVGQRVAQAQGRRTWGLLAHAAAAHLPSSGGVRRLGVARALHGFQSGWAARGHVEHALVAQQRAVTGLVRGVKRALIWGSVVLVAGVALSQVMAPQTGRRS